MERRSLLLAGLALAALPLAAKASPAPAMGSAADLSGVWLVVGGDGAAGEFPQSQWLRGPMPFTAEGKAAFDAARPGKGPRLVPPARGNDPIGGANPPGLLRAMIYPRMFEFVQKGDRVVQLFEFGRVWRNIYADGRPVPEDIAAGPFWYGWSVGRWEGDTLVVNTLALDERAWMDEWGTPFSAEAKFEERWRRVAPDRLEMTLKVHDPVMYTRDWTSAPKSYRLQAKGVDPYEIIFAPMDELVFNGDIRDPAGLPAPK